MPVARIDTGQNRCKVKGARLWNDYFNVTNNYLYKKSFRQHIRKALVDNFDVEEYMCQDMNMPMSMGNHGPLYIYIYIYI